MKSFIGLSTHLFSLQALEIPLFSLPQVAKAITQFTRRASPNASTEAASDAPRAGTVTGAYERPGQVPHTVASSGADQDTHRAPCNPGQATRKTTTALPCSGTAQATQRAPYTTPTGITSGAAGTTNGAPCTTPELQPTVQWQTQVTTSRAIRNYYAPAANYGGVRVAQVSIRNFRFFSREYPYLLR